MSEQSTNASEAAVAAVDKTALHNAIKAQFNNLVDVKPTKFNFKKVEEKDEQGKVLSTSKRPSVEVEIPVPSVEGIVAILENGQQNPKALELLLEAVANVIMDQGRSVINANESITDQSNFPIEQLGWDYIANLPKAERRGGGIAKEDWDAFAVDYAAVMPSVTGKPQQHIDNAVKVYLQKFATCKTQKKILAKLKEQLGIYLVNTPNAEDHQEAVTWLMNKIDTLSALDEDAMLQAL